jgi:hypothetical protein
MINCFSTRKRAHIKKINRILIVFSALLLLAVILYLNREPIIRGAYQHGYFDNAFSNNRMMNGSQPDLLNFDFSLRDMEFFNAFGENDSRAADKRQKVDVAIDGKHYAVDLTPFKNYFKDVALNKRKNAFSIRFSLGNPLENKIRRWDLFQIRKVDFFRQELVYDLGRRLGLLVPETRYVNVYINYVDYGDYAFKQSYDHKFSERSDIPDSITFMLERKTPGGDSGKQEWTIRCLCQGKKKRLVEKHLEHFLELLKQKDPNLLVKFFDLDYLARFEALGKLLRAASGFTMEDNIRYIYNGLNGKFYPVLDESNIYNMQRGKKNQSLELLRKQIEKNRFIRRKRKEYLARLGAPDSLAAIKAHYRKLWKKYDAMPGDLLHQARLNLVAEYFNIDIYRRLRQMGKTPGPGKTGEIHPGYSPVRRAGSYLDRMLLSAGSFLKMNPRLALEIEGSRVKLKPGHYTLYNSLTVPLGYIFEIPGGVTLRLGPGVSIICCSPVHIAGTAGKPVKIEALDPGKPFAVFAVHGGESEENTRIAHLDFSGAKGGFIDGVLYDGGLDIRNTRAEIRDCAIHDNLADAGLNLVNCTVLLENNRFYGNFSDQASLAFCRGRVRNCAFFDSGGDPGSDGAALKGSTILFHASRFENLRDKGASISDRSIAVFYDNRFQANGTGVGTRDLGQTLLADNRFINNGAAVSAYRKDEESEGGGIYLLPNIFKNNRLQVDSDGFSRRLDLRNRSEEAGTLRELVKKTKTGDIFALFTRLRKENRPRENSIEEFYIAGAAAQIDREAKIILVDLPPGSAALQPVRFAARLPGTHIYITPTAYGSRGIDRLTAREERLENRGLYDFQEYIFRGRLRVAHGFQGDAYELIVSKGALPIVEIDTSDDNGSAKRIKNEPKIPCRIRMMSFHPAPGGVDNWHLNRYLSGRIEGRGTKREKWKYGITLEKRIAPGGMKKSRRWVLESMYIDRTLMRPKIAFDLYDRFRGPSLKRIAPHSRLVEVYLDGGYRGVYLLMEHIDRNFLELGDFDKEEPFNALLYRAENNNANFTPTNVELLEGGDYEDFPGRRQPVNKANDPIRGWASGFEQRWPDSKDYGEYWQPLSGFSKFAATASNQEFSARIFDLMDIDRFINLWILIQLLDDLDGLYQNRYLARERGRYARWCFIPWDKDGVFGRDYKMGKRLHTTWLRTPLFDRCMTIGPFREALRETWISLRKQGVISTQAIYALIDANAAALEEAQKRNFKRWPLDSRREPYPDSYDFHRETRYMKEWISQRIQWLDQRFQALYGQEVLP